MNSRDSTDPGVANLLEALGRMPRPEAPVEFRMRLRAEFVLGTVPAGVRRESARRFARRWIAMSAAAGALALLIVTFLNAGPAWRVTAATGAGVVQVDGRGVPLEQLHASAARLRSGTVLEVPEGGQLDLELPGIAVMQIVGGTRMVVGGGPGRWFARSMSSTLVQGEARVSTGPGLARAQLTIVTPETRARVTGTTFAVIRNADASCVCVLDGRVAMISGAAADTVNAGFRRSVFRDSRSPLVEPILPMETMKLTMLRESADRGLRR